MQLHYFHYLVSSWTSETKIFSAKFRLLRIIALFVFQIFCITWQEIKKRHHIRMWQSKMHSVHRAEFFSVKPRLLNTRELKSKCFRPDILSVPYGKRKSRAREAGRAAAAAACSLRRPKHNKWDILIKTVTQNCVALQYFTCFDTRVADLASLVFLEEWKFLRFIEDFFTSFKQFIKRLGAVKTLGTKGGAEVVGEIRDTHFETHTKGCDDHFKFIAAPDCKIVIKAENKFNLLFEQTLSGCFKKLALSETSQ